MQAAEVLFLYFVTGSYMLSNIHISGFFETYPTCIQVKIVILVFCFITTLYPWEQLRQNRQAFKVVESCVGGPSENAPKTH